jgi:small subunit ribosomal protein S4
MNKLRPRNKICLQNNKNIHANLNIIKLKKKKWQLLKTNNFFTEKKKSFFKKLRKIKQDFKLIRIENKSIKKNKFQTKSLLILLKDYYLNKRPEKKKQLFKERLFAKQQFKNFYGCIPEYQLKNLFFYLKNKTNNNNIIQKFIILLESRLDMVIYRSKITKTVFQAKQIINHGKIKVNNKIITSSNIILNRGDIITLNNFKIIKNFYYINKVKIIKLKKNKIKKFTRLIRILKKNKVNYIQINNKYNFYIFLKKPSFTEIQYPFKLDLKLIDEYFRKN